MCGTASQKRGICGTCKTPYEAVCPVCGYGKDACICTGPMKKDAKPR
jgi:hypothetical protein